MCIRDSLWTWLTGVFGIATKYAESLIAVKYRVKTEDGRMQGGAMYALEKMCIRDSVNARQEGKWTHYSLSKSGSEYASKRLLELTTPNTENQSNCCK